MWINNLFPPDDREGEWEPEIACYYLVLVLVDLLLTEDAFFVTLKAFFATFFVGADLAAAILFSEVRFFFDVVLKSPK